MMFDEYFQKIYGDRWASLRVALLADPVQGLWPNPFVAGETSLRLKPAGEVIIPTRQKNGLLDVYVLDPASVYVAQALGVDAGEKILDMCAAPGGKSLILFSALAESGSLIANDISPDRRFRMKKIFQQYIPEEARQRIQILGQDAVQFGLRQAGHFDRVLLDAPCSGEKHLMERPADLAEWKPKRSEALAQRQYALLCAALLAVRPGGTIVYSTCSMNPKENDGVIEKLVKKKSELFKVLPLPAAEGSEATQFGRQFLPDLCGFGPMYCCKLQKNESLSPDRT